jgi:hypothetical protein
MDWVRILLSRCWCLFGGVGEKPRTEAHIAPCEVVVENMDTGKDDLVKKQRTRTPPTGGETNR